MLSSEQRHPHLPHWSDGVTGKQHSILDRALEKQALWSEEELETNREGVAKRQSPPPLAPHFQHTWAEL